MTNLSDSAVSRHAIALSPSADCAARYAVRLFPSTKGCQLAIHQRHSAATSSGLEQDSARIMMWSRVPSSLTASRRDVSFPDAHSIAFLWISISLFLPALPEYSILCPGHGPPPGSHRRMSHASGFGYGRRDRPGRASRTMEDSDERKGSEEDICGHVDC